MFKQIVTTILVMLPLDALWLFSMKNIYDRWLINFERQVNWYGVGLVYIAIPLGLFYFVISKYAGQIPGSKALLDGFLYGIFTYAVYDLTNLATLKNWSIQMTVVDIIWGGMLCMTTTYIALWFLSKV